MLAALFLSLPLAVSVRAQTSKANPPSLPSPKIDAQALLNDVLSKVPHERGEMHGVLKIRSSKGSLREVPIKWIVRPLDGQWHDVYTTPQNGGIPPETLIVVHREGATNHYEFIRDGNPVPAAAADPFVPFATSDFWLADFGLEFLHWPNPKHLKTEMRKGRPCYVIESSSPRPGLPYARVLSWIDTEHGGLIRAEAFDPKGALLKEFTIANIDKVNGRWRVKELLIRNDQADTQTRLIFNLEIPE